MLALPRYVFRAVRAAVCLLAAAGSCPAVAASNTLTDKGVLKGLVEEGFSPASIPCVFHIPSLGDLVGELPHSAFGRPPKGSWPTPNWPHKPKKDETPVLRCSDATILPLRTFSFTEPISIIGNSFAVPFFGTTGVNRFTISDKALLIERHKKYVHEQTTNGFSMFYLCSSSNPAHEHSERAENRTECTYHGARVQIRLTEGIAGNPKNCSILAVVNDVSALQPGDKRPVFMVSLLSDYCKGKFRGIAYGSAGLYLGPKKDPFEKFIAALLASLKGPAQ